MKIDKLCVKYKNKAVVSDLSVTIRNNEKVALLGKNGAGKTSLIKALLNLVSFDGVICDKPRFSVVFQEDRLVSELSCKQNVLLACPLANAEEVLQKVGLEDKADDKVSALSGGMKRRVAIARALAKDCDMLIADEPFSALDLTNKAFLSSVLTDFLKDKGLLLITHDLFQAYALCERIIIIDEGKIVLDVLTKDALEQDVQKWFEKNL